MADTAHKSDLDAAFEAVRKLPPENQAEIIRFLREYVEEQHAPSLLTEEQNEEVRRRLADPNPVLIPQDEVFAKLRKHLGI